jgi:hypothetical protein
MMLKASIPVDRGSQAISNGSLPRAMQDILGQLKPEAAYFLALDGKRTMLVFFDLADPSQIPAISEPFFMAFGADLELYPVMNAEDLQKGLPAAEEAAKKFLSS